MPLVRAQCVLPMRTNLPRDVITNTFHFGSEYDMTLAISNLDVALSNFYLEAYALGMASYVRYEAAYIKYYDLLLPEPRVPTISTDLGTNLGAGISSANTQIPTEVAAVLSFEAPPVSGTPQSRRRGRVYLGGIAETMITASSGSTPFFPIWEPAFITDVTEAAEDNLLNLDAATSGDLQWAVYSPTSGPVTAYTITQGWFDNGPDTQRRRSVAATARTTWP